MSLFEPSFVGYKGACLFADVSSRLLSTLACMSRGDHNAWGKTMPSGVIRGAAPLFSNSELETLVSITQRVSGQCLSTWDFPVAPFLS